MAGRQDTSLGGTLAVPGAAGGQNPVTDSLCDLGQVPAPCLGFPTPNKGLAGLPLGRRR